MQPGGDKKAYRKLARCSHPDVCGTNDATEFRKITEAYENINTASKRKAYDEKLKREREKASQSSNSSLWQDNEITWSTNTFYTDFDQMINSLFFPQFSELPFQLELIITEQEARSGVTIPLSIPFREACSLCEDLFWGIPSFCDRCHGLGYIEKNFSAKLQIPPNIQNQSRLKIIIPGIGLMTIRIFIQ